MPSGPYEVHWDFNSDDRELFENFRRIDELHSDEAPASPGALYVCIQVQKVDAVERLLSAGVSANARLRPEDDWILEITEWWDRYAVPRNGFSEDHREWFPLYQAAVSSTGAKEEHWAQKGCHYGGFTSSQRRSVCGIPATAQTVQIFGGCPFPS